MSALYGRIIYPFDASLWVVRGICGDTTVLYQDVTTYFKTHAVYLLKRDDYRAFYSINLAFIALWFVSFSGRYKTYVDLDEK